MGTRTTDDYLRRTASFRDGQQGVASRRQLAAAGISLPVIYITGNDNHATRMAALQSGCIAYLTKPFPAKSLIEPIELASARSA